MLKASSDPPRILVVEDEVLIQMLAVDLLEGMGFEVDVAGSAAEAKSKLRMVNGSVQAAIIDLGLPDAKGDMLIGELRALYPDLAIVVSSGQPDSAIRERLNDHAPIGILSKPYTAEQLSNVLRTVRGGD